MVGSVGQGTATPILGTSPLSSFTSGGAGEAATRRTAGETFAMSMPLRSTTIRRNTLRLLRPAWAAPLATLVPNSGNREFVLADFRTAK